METRCHSLHRLKHRAVITLIIVCSLLFYIILMNLFFYKRTLEIIGVLRYVDQDIQQQALYNLYSGSIEVLDGKYVLMKNGYQFSGQFYLVFDSFFIGINVAYLFLMFYGIHLYKTNIKKQINSKDKELNYLKTEVEHFLFGSLIDRNDDYRECNYLLDRLEQRMYDMNQLNEKELKQIISFHQDIIHQIITPLNTIRILIEYLYMKGNIDNDYLDNMSYAIEKASDLANLYLKSSKIDTGKVSYHFEDINLYELVDEVLNDLQIYANYYHSILSNQCENLIIHVDSLWIKEAIGNIVKNSIENSGEKKKILISSFLTDNLIYIKIENEANIDEIQNINFERFESSKSGIGIGLHLCKQIVEAHLGEIFVEKNKLGGLSFVIQLPRQSYKKKVDWRTKDEDNCRN